MRTGDIMPTFGTFPQKDFLSGLPQSLVIISIPNCHGMVDG
jgi:hypothetical protein